MFSRRKEFNKKLQAICPNVYFQPPDNLNLKFPAIVYSYDDVDDKFANNAKYGSIPGYQVIVIDVNPDSTIANQINRLPRSSFVREFKKDNLNHYIYRVYY